MRRCAACCGGAPRVFDWLLLFAQARGEALRHPTRIKLMAIVEAHPGITLTSLRDAVGCSWGTIQHHTRALERRGRLRSEPVGRSRRFFTDTVSPARRRGLALLRRGRVQDLVDAIARAPGRKQRELTEGLNLTRKVLRSYVDDLVAAGLVVETQESRARVYHPTVALEGLLRELLAHPSDSSSAEPAPVAEVGSCAVVAKRLQEA